MRKLATLLFLLLVSLTPAFARVRTFGWCEVGNTVVTLQGFNAPQLVQGSYPQCTVTVYKSGSQSVSTARYISGGTITGIAGQTITLLINGGNGSATATATLSATNTIGPNAALIINTPGAGFTAPPTTATCSSGTATCSGTVTITSTMIGTIATLYADNNGTPLSNPFIASKQGFWYFYPDNGRYDVQFTLGIPNTFPTPFTEGDVLSIDPFFDSEFSTLQQGCQVAASIPTTLTVTTAWKNLATQTFNCDMNFQKGGSLQPGSGQALTLSTIRAGLYQIFDLSLGGTIVSYRAPQAYPDWFGADATGATNSDAAFAGLLATSNNVQVNNGTYSFASPMVIKNSGQALRCLAPSTVTLKFGATDGVQINGTNLTNVYLTNCTITGTGAASTTGINVLGTSSYVTLGNNTISGFTTGVGAANSLKMSILSNTITATTGIALSGTTQLTYAFNNFTVGAAANICPACSTLNEVQATSRGNFLAGVPIGQLSTLDVTGPPFYCDSTGATDTSACVNNAIKYTQTHASSMCLTFPGGTYNMGTTTMTINGGPPAAIPNTNPLGPICIKGPGHAIDPINSGSAWYNPAIIQSAANPILEVCPYAGTEISGLHLEGLGTTKSIELYDVASYPGQVGIWAGNIQKPLLSSTTTPVDDFGVGGCGGLYMHDMHVNGASKYGMGWGFYGYKFWGLSIIANLTMSNTGQVPPGGDPDNYGGVALAAETVDIEFDGVNVTSCTAPGNPPGPGQGCQAPVNPGTYIKLDAASTKYVPLNRVDHGTSHITFINPRPGDGDINVAAYCWHQYSAIQTVVIGGIMAGCHKVDLSENYYSGNGGPPGFQGTWDSAVNMTLFQGVGFFRVDEIDVANNGRVMLSNVMNESYQSNANNVPVPNSVPMYLKYWVPVEFSGKGFTPMPSYGFAQMNYSPGAGSSWNNTPVMITTDQNDQDQGPNLVPPYTDPCWTINRAPLTGGIIYSFDTPLYLGLYPGTTGGTSSASCSLTLEPNTLYTMGVMENNDFGVVRSSITYGISTNAGNMFTNAFDHGDQGDIQNASEWRIVQFVTPADGQITVTYTNTDPDTAHFYVPIITKGARSHLNFYGLPITWTDNQLTPVVKAPWPKYPELGGDYYPIMVHEITADSFYAKPECPALPTTCIYVFNPFWPAAYDVVTPIPANVSTFSFPLFPITPSLSPDDLILRPIQVWTFQGAPGTQPPNAAVTADIGASCGTNSQFYIKAANIFGTGNVQGYAPPTQFAHSTGRGIPCWSVTNLQATINITGGTFESFVEDSGFTLWVKLAKLR